MNNKEAIANLNHIYGMLAPDIQRSLDVAIKALGERPQGDLISREALKEKLQARYDNGEEDFDKGYNIGLEAAIDLIDNAPTVPLQNEQITWEQGYECGYHQAKEDAIRRIAKQYSEHHELIPEWLSVGDMRGGKE